MSQKPLSCQERIGKQEGKEESIGEGGHEQEFAAGFPGQEAGALVGQFTFMETDRHFDLPTAGIGQETQSWTCNNQPQVLLVGRIMDGESHHTDLALAASFGIPEQAIFPRALVFADLPGLACATLFIDQTVAFLCPSPGPPTHVCQWEPPSSPELTPAASGN